MGDFGVRMDELASKVGSGFCVGKVVVDQVYAQYIHEDLALRHRHGGGAQYLTKPLLLGRESFLAEISRSCLEDGGVTGMIASVERLARGIEEFAPTEFGHLHRSGHPMVFSPSPTAAGEGDLRYDRPPEQSRLTESELRAEDRTVPYSGGLIGWIWRHSGHVSGHVGRGGV
jgi:hypothetical protein